eukprot:1179385-Prorocentrum_minimum.AAC.2
MATTSVDKAKRCVSGRPTWLLAYTEMYEYHTTDRDDSAFVLSVVRFVGLSVTRLVRYRGAVVGVRRGSLSR